MEPTPDLLAIVQRAHEAAAESAMLKGAQRSAALQAMAKAVQQQQDRILEANTLDLETSREMAVPELILEWLRLTPERLQMVIHILQQLANSPDPLQRLLNVQEPVTSGQTYGRLTPLGVIALVFESFPDLGAIAAGMCIRTGNSLVMRGGTEASQTNQVIAEILQGALEDAKLPKGALELVPPDSGDSIRELVMQDEYIDLVLPYGRTSLVQQVIRQANVPVLKTSIGNCYLYWAPSGSVDMTRWMILESHRSEPDPVNAIEKVLIHHRQDVATLQMLWRNLQDKGFQLRGDEKLVADFPELALVKPGDWGQPYLTQTVAFRVVDSPEQAINWMNRYSSGHADALVTESYTESQQFATHLNSATLFINASPRFCRYPKQGTPIALGMSNQKGHHRGFITLSSLMTTKHIVQGHEAL
ncbi:MAG: glutamate-5-semialdehyde dehydrogenase [Cyanobacteria bacterium J06638_22]